MSIKKKILIFVSLALSTIIVLTTCLVVTLSDRNVTVTYEDDCIVFHNTPYDIELNYDEINSIDIVDTKFGNEYVSGDYKFRTWEIGVYKNDTYGKYSSIVSKQSKKSIVASLEGNFYYIIGLKDLDETLNVLQHIVNNTSVKNIKK